MALLCLKTREHYCPGMENFHSRETISKNQHIFNNGIHVIYNMAAVIHHLLLNKLNSQNCKAERMNIVDYFIKYKKEKNL